MVSGARQRIEREVALYLAHEVCGYPREETETQASTTPIPEQARDIVDIAESGARFIPRRQQGVGDGD